MNCYKAIPLKILIINGPNLNLLGTREPEVYGNQDFDSYLSKLRNEFSTCKIEYFQSNLEGEIIEALHSTIDTHITGVILNAGGFSHTSVAIADAIASIDTPVISVHISNIYTRESERHKELMAQYTLGGIFGLGLDGYEFALRKLISQ